MSAHTQYIELIDQWDPEGPDLSDDLALHLDGCEACSAHFDARFAAWDGAEAEVAPPVDLAERVLPRQRRVRWPIWAGGALSALAAAAVAMVTFTAGTAYQAPLSSAEPVATSTPVDAVVGNAAELPSGSASHARHSKSKAGSVQGSPEELKMLRQLGYIDGDGTAVKNEETHSWTEALGYTNSPASGEGELAIIRGNRVSADATTRGEVLTKEFLQRIPAGRNYQSAVQTTSGVTGNDRWRESNAPANHRPDDHDGRNGDKDDDAVAAVTVTTEADNKARYWNAQEEAALADIDAALANVDGVPMNGAERFTDYGINPFETVAYDPLSTFSVDVDTASYTLARRTLREGHLPAHAAVRVEEFVNTFPYDYAPPGAGDPFRVHFEASPSPWNPRTHIVRIGLQGRKVAFDQRKPVHLTFLVDTSGSMQSSDKMGLVKSSLKLLTDELQDGDTVALAAYAGSAGVILPPTPMSQKRDVLKALDRLTAGGSTAMGAGIELAYDLADKTYEPGAVNRVIIASDGDANVGITDHEILTTMIGHYADKGITLTTLGFGRGNYRDTMMERLANDGDGNYFYVDSQQEAERVFRDRLTGTLEVIARDVKIQVAWHPEAVARYRLLGYENRDVADADFRNDAVDAGEVGAGHQVTALYEVVLAKEPRDPLATVRVRHKAPGPEAPSVERSFDLGLDHVRPSVQETTRAHRMALSAAAFAELLRGSPFVREVSYGEVERMARGAARAEYPQDKELVELIARARELSGQ